MSARPNAVARETAAVDTLDERALLDGVLARDQRAWTQLVHRFSGALRATIREAVGDRLSDAQLDDVFGDFWLKLLEDDMRRVRSFAASRGAPLASWLTIQVSQVANEFLLRVSEEPITVSLGDCLDGQRPRDAPTMMRVEEIAERWGLNVKTVYAMIDRGELAARRCGRVLRVPRHVVESFEQGRAVSGGK
jgi:excisionase family DNA binding protein